jgi:hypothetical protein
MEAKINTVISFKSLDSAYRIDHLYIPEIPVSTKINNSLPVNEFALPLNKKQLTVYCYALNHVPDTLTLLIDYEMRTYEHNSYCYDDHGITYRRKNVQVVSSTLDSVRLVFGSGDYGITDRAQALRDTVYFKP